MRTPICFALVSLLVFGHGMAHADLAKGKAVYEKTCAVCHASGLAGAPKYGDAAGWAPRIKGGVAALYGSALNGKPPAMPKKGGALDTPDAEIKSAVDYMVASVQTKADAKKDEKKPEDKSAKSDKSVEAAAKLLRQHRPLQPPRRLRLRQRPHPRPLLGPPQRVRLRRRRPRPRLVAMQMSMPSTAC